MKCLRCGYCCRKLSVVIVADPKLGVREDNLEIYNGDSRCKHLRGDKPGEYSCSIHNEPWYSQTGCAQYNSMGDGNCRMGQAVMSGELKLDYPELEWSWGNILIGE